MERKGGSTAVVTAHEVSVALAGTRAKTVAAEEEKALRMRFGAKVDPTAPLARAAGDNQELGDELLIIEMQLLKAIKRQKAMAAAATAPHNPTKDKILRSLRKKR